MRTTVLAILASALLVFAGPAPTASAYPERHVVQGVYTYGASTPTARILDMSIKASLLQRDGVTRAHASYIPDGMDGHEYMRVTDLRSDGRRVAVRWAVVGGTTQGICINKSGYQENYRSYCKLPIPEGVTIRFTVGSCDATVNGCDAYTDWKWSREHYPPYVYSGWADYNDDANTKPGTDCNEGSRKGDC